MNEAQFSTIFWGVNFDLFLFQVKWLEENCRTKTNIKPQVHIVSMMSKS